MSTATCARFGREPVALAERVHDDRPLERLEHGCAQLRGSRLLGQAADVDAPDADALADLLGVRAVVRVDASRADEEEQADEGGYENSTLTHGGPQDGRRRPGGREPCNCSAGARTSARRTRSAGPEHRRVQSRCADVRVSMPRTRRSSPRDRVTGAGLQTRLVGAVAALVLACGGFLAYRAIAAIDDAYRWTGEAEAATVARGFARSLSPRDLHDLERIRARAERLGGVHPDLIGVAVDPRRRRPAALRRLRRRTATLEFPLIDARRPAAAVLRLAFAHDERAEAPPPGGARCCWRASAPRCC